MLEQAAAAFGAAADIGLTIGAVVLLAVVSLQGVFVGLRIIARGLGGSGRE